MEINESIKQHERSVKWRVGVIKRQNICKLLARLRKQTEDSIKWN
jgi:hypothetical protein